MPSPNVDLVFVIDASGSMQPCFDHLVAHLGFILHPLQGNAAQIRYGLVAQHASKALFGTVYWHHFLGGSDPDSLQALYRPDRQGSHGRNDFFTGDRERFSRVLSSVQPQGDEEMLVALDIAADFPFGPLSKTKRVIAMFTDERIEGGVSKGGFNSMIPKLREKLMARHIQLFAALPDSPAAQLLAETDRSEIELVQGGDGLKNVDFGKLLTQMGKSISVSSLQSTTEPHYEHALFGQDQWSESDAQIGRDS